MIKLMKPQLPGPDQLQPFLQQIADSGIASNGGPLVQQLQRELQGFIHAPCEVVSSGTAALELALYAAHVVGKRVLIPALTFHATATACYRMGNEVLLADVDDDTWQMTPEIARAVYAVQPFDAVIPVATFGRPFSSDDMREWGQLQRDLQVPVIVDAAAAFGAQRADGLAPVQAVCFSMHATKALPAGEGGIVASLDREFLFRVRQLASFGHPQATNARLSEYHAAVALASLRQWDMLSQYRQDIRRYYTSMLKNVLWQPWPPGAVPSTLVVRMPGHDAGRVQVMLKERDIETRRWYYPTVDQRLNLICNLPVTEQLRVELLGLPFHLFLTDEEVDIVCKNLQEVL